MKSLSRLFLFAVVTAALMLVGCGGDSSTGTTPDTTQTDTAQTDTTQSDTPCTPTCGANSCGDDGCGGTCACASGSTCNTTTNQCEEDGCKSDSDCDGAVEGEPCKVAVCNQDGTCGMANAVNGTECNDKDMCTETDVCTDGACAGTAIADCEKGCDWLIDPISFEPTTEGDTCVSKVVMSDASVTNGKLSVGPVDFAFSFPLGELALDLQITQGRFESNIVGTFDINDGRLCGIVTKQVLSDALDKACEVPTEGTEQLCGLKGIVVSLLDTVCDGDNCTIVLGMDGVEAKSMTLDTVDGADFPTCQPPTELANAGSHVTAMTMPGEAKDFDCDSNNDGSIDKDDGDINELISLAAGIAPDFDINATLAENITEGDLIFIPAIKDYEGGDATDLEMVFYIGTIPQPGFPDQCNDVPVD